MSSNSGGACTATLQSPVVLAAIPEEDRCSHDVRRDEDTNSHYLNFALRTLHSTDDALLKSRLSIDDDISPVSTECGSPANLRDGFLTEHLTTTSDVFGTNMGTVMRSASLKLPPQRQYVGGNTGTSTSNELVWCPSRTNLTAELRRRLSEQVIRTCERQRSESAIHFASWKESKWGEDQFDFETTDFKSGFDLGVFDAFDFILVAKKLRAFLDQMQIAIWSATRDAVDCPRRQVNDCPKRADRCPKRKRAKALDNVAGDEDPANFIPQVESSTAPPDDVDDVLVIDEHTRHSAATTTNPATSEMDVAFSMPQLMGCVH